MAVNTVEAMKDNERLRAKLETLQAEMNAMRWTNQHLANRVDETVEENQVLYAKWRRIEALPDWMRAEHMDQRTVAIVQSTIDCINKTATPEQGRAYMESPPRRRSSMDPDRRPHRHRQREKERDEWRHFCKEPDYALWFCVGLVVTLVIVAFSVRWFT